MNHKLLLRLCLQQTTILDDNIPQDEDSVTLGEIVQAFAAHADLLNRTQRYLWTQAGRGRLLDAPAIGEQITGLLHVAIAKGRMLQKKANANDATQESYTEEIGTTLRYLEQLLDMHLKGWPAEEPPSKGDILAAHERGEFLQPDEAFADIVGMGKEEWLQHVEEHKQKYHHAVTE